MGPRKWSITRTFAAKAPQSIPFGRHHPALCLRYEPDEAAEARLSGRLELTPQERVLAMLGDPDEHS